jgi:hypothetical protein
MMGRSSVALFMLAITTGCITATPSANSQCPDCPPENHLLLDIASNSTARFYVRADVNGVPKKFFLDTGAARSAVTVDAETRTLKGLGPLSFGGVGLKPQKCDSVVVGDVAVAGVHQRNMPMARCGSELAAASDMLGIDAFQNRRVSFDFTRAEISLQATPPATGLQKMRRGAFGYIELPVTIGNDVEWAVFDTGCGMTVVDRSIVDRQPQSFKPVTTDVDGQVKPVFWSFSDSTGQNVEGQLYLAEHLNIGDFALNEQLVTVVSFSQKLKDIIHSSLVIGANTMLAANWYFDLKANLWAASADNNRAAHLRLQIAADEVLRQDAEVIILRGHAKVNSGDFSLLGAALSLNIKTNELKCFSDCEFVEPQKTTKSSAITVELGDQGWRRQN